MFHKPEKFMPALSFFDLISSIKIHNIYSSPIIFSARSPHGGLQQLLIHLSEGLTYNHNTSSPVLMHTRWLAVLLWHGGYYVVEKKAKLRVVKAA